MHVHHLNCGTFEPRFGALSYGSGGAMVTHVTAIETSSGLVLIDSGVGLDDCANPAARISPMLRWAGGARLDPTETAALQLEALGYSRDDVTDIVLTHMDVDHTGGLPDFPRARVHVHADELHGFIQRQSFAERGRYQPLHLSEREVETYHGGSDRWRGLAGAERLRGVDAEIWLIPLPGHSRGHAVVGYTVAGRDYLHVGDAYYHRGQVRPEVAAPWTFNLFAGMTRFEPQQRRASLEALGHLLEAHPDVTMYCTHDPVELAAVRAHVASAAS